MALSRATALLTTAAQVVDLTGVQDLANLESASEFSVEDSLLRAHEWVFDHVEQSLGPDAPAKLSNTTRLERAVACRFLEVLFATGQLDAGGIGLDPVTYWREEARDELARFRPVYTDDRDAPRRASEGVPSIGSLDRGLLSGSSLTRDRYWQGRWPLRRT